MSSAMMIAMKDLLLQATRTNIEIRRRYASIKSDKRARYFVYVLQLRDNKFYVGSTDNIFARLLEHETQSRYSSKWVQKHGPVNRVVEIVQNASADVETTKTLHWMDMMGFENVRGGPYCTTALLNPPKALATFSRPADAEYMYLPRNEIDSIHAMVRTLAPDVRAIEEQTYGDDENDGSIGGSVCSAPDIDDIPDDKPDDKPDVI